MGVIHKLRPDVRDYIIEKKKTTPALSCRQLTSLIIEQFQINVSKSSINAIFKENNLSMPIGRRPKQKKKKFNLPALPVIEGIKAITLVADSNKPVQEPIVNLPLSVVKEEPNLEEKRIKEAEEWALKLQEEERARMQEKLNLEKQRLKDENLKLKAEEEAQKARQEKLAKEAQEQARQAEEDAKRLEEEAAASKAEKERLVKEVEEQTRRELDEAKRLEEAAKQARQEKLAKEAEEQARKKLEEAQKQARQAEEERKRLEGEAELKAEKEKWARLAEAELKSKQPAVKEEVNIQKIEISHIDLLPTDRGCSGAVLLKAIDCLIGGSKQINEAICKITGNHPEDFIALTQAIIFKSLFGSGKDNHALLCSLAGQQIPQEKLDSYYLEIKENKTIKSDIARIIASAFTEARGVKVHFIDGGIVYLDGQLHTTWSTPYLPYDFASTVYDLKNSLNKCFFENHPLVLLSAPGYDMPTKEFFNLLLNMSLANKGPDNVILYGNKLEEFENISLNQENNYSFVFGLWPWQFTNCRKIKKIGNFNPEHIEGIDKDLYLAEIELDLLQASTNQSITLQGCAVKTDLKEKIRVVILSSDQGLVNLNKLAQIYLSRWPNLDEGFADFSRRVEVFTYAGSSQSSFSTENIGLNLTEINPGLEEIFANYVKALDAYLRWHFLPAGYAKKDFSFTNECFYKAPAKLVTSQAKVTAQMQVNQEGKPPLKDLEYLICRLNERQINLGNGKIFYFENVFK